MVKEEQNKKEQNIPDIDEDYIEQLITGNNLMNHLNQNDYSELSYTTLDEMHQQSIKKIEKEFPITFSHVENNVAIFNGYIEDFGDEYIENLPTIGEVMSGEGNSMDAWFRMIDAITNEVKKYWPINSRYRIQLDMNQRLEYL